MKTTDTISANFGIPFPGGATPSSFKGVDLSAYYRIPSKELVGIEIEIENYISSKHTYHPFWLSKDDGSLRNHGREFVTKPVQAEYVPFLLHNLFHTHLKESASCTPRTSVHVHLNVLDMPMEKINLFVLYYSLYERVLFSWIGKNRYKNIYCVPITSCSLMNALKNKIVPDWSKYTAVNLLPVSRQGTIEFRAMHGTKDLNKLCKWVNMIVHMKHYIMKNTTEQLEDCYKNLDAHSDFLTLGKEFLGEAGIEILHKHGFLESRVEDTYPFLLGKFRYTKSTLDLASLVSPESFFYKRK